MSNKKIVVQVKAVGFFGLLAIGFIVLKLSQVIQWSWVWVLAPLWIPPATVISSYRIPGLLFDFLPCSRPATA